MNLRKAAFVSLTCVAEARHQKSDTIALGVSRSTSIWIQQRHTKELFVNKDDLAYYERRAREEADAAAAADDVKAASAHRLLAIQYQEHVRELREGRQDKRALLQNDNSSRSNEPSPRRKLSIR